MPIEPGSGRWFEPYRKHLFCLACAIEHSHGSSDLTAVRLVPLRHFWAVCGCFWSRTCSVLLGHCCAILKLRSGLLLVRGGLTVLRWRRIGRWQDSAAQHPHGTGAARTLRLRTRRGLRCR